MRRKATKLTMREVTEKDAKMLFDWANQEHVRKFAFSKEKISFEKHSLWLEKKLYSKASYIFIALSQTKPIGQIRFDEDESLENLFEVDIHLDKQSIGKGIGGTVLQRGIHCLKKCLGHEFCVRATIFKTNVASNKCFLSQGFKFEKESMINNVPCNIYTRWVR